MKICKSGRVIERLYHNEKHYYIRLNLVDDSLTGKNRFSVKDVSTGLLANRQNKSKADAMVFSLIEEYNRNSSADYFDIYIQDWLSGKKGTLEATTYEGYEYRVSVIASYFSKHKVLLPELKPTDVKAFYEYLTIVEHGEGKRHINGYSNRSMKDISMVLKSALNEAVVLKMIPENPAVHVKVPYRVEDKQPKSYISFSEKDCFMDAIKGHRLETAFIMALYYGLRRSEICGLKWSAIHDDGKLYIEHTVTRMKTTVAKMSSDDISKGKYGYLNTGELVLGTGEFGMSPLSGKIAAFTGDSICDGPGYPGGYAKIIGDENNMTVQNIAEGGGAIVPTSEYFCISTSIADLRADADYIILEGGVNDSGRLYPLGTITEGYSDKLDTTTFAGAFENMLKSAISRFPGKKIGFIITHKCHDRFDSTTTGSYYSVAVEACKKWGVPYLDLNSLVPPLAYIDELRMAYTDNGDGYHPNEQGYRQFYVDKIVAWMKTL